MLLITDLDAIERAIHRLFSVYCCSVLISHSHALHALCTQCHTYYTCVSAWVWVSAVFFYSRWMKTHVYSKQIIPWRCSLICILYLMFTSTSSACFDGLNNEYAVCFVYQNKIFKLFNVYDVDVLLSTGHKWMVKGKRTLVWMFNGWTMQLCVHRSYYIHLINWLASCRLASLHFSPFVFNHSHFDPHALK